MKNATPAANAIRTLALLLDKAEADLRTWRRNGIPVEQKLAEIEAMRARREALAAR